MRFIGLKGQRRPKMTIWKKYSYTWLTSIFFLFSLALHWGFAWPAYVNESREHNQEPNFKEYFIQTGRDTFENWQSEFLQLIWQVAGLAFLFHIGSAQSKEGEERLEAKVDYLLHKLEPDEATKIIKSFEKKWPKK
jgi:hypothetical protein